MVTRSPIADTRGCLRGVAASMRFLSHGTHDS
jgi:hypothetical protein